MQKVIEKIKAIALMLFFAAGFTACSSDLAEDPISPSPSTGDKVSVNITIGVQPSSSPTRVSTPIDGSKEENMFNWFVLVVKDNKIEKVLKSENTLDGVTQDNITNAELDEGIYDFYSFANLTETEVLGSAATVGASVNLDAKAFTMQGNGFKISDTQHIPMSNKQTIMIDANNQNVTLWVVRMLAKVKLELKNETGSDITIKSATLSDITQNGNDNIMLLPKKKDNAENDACQPNLSAGTPKDYIYTPTEHIKMNANEEKDMVFYINESVTPTNNHGLFTLTLEIVKAGETTSTYQRYALITDNENHEWNYIARNDYRVIPVTLQDYKLDIIPYDFPPIAVYPAAVKEADGLFTITFHAAGHFHLQPVVTKYSTGEQVAWTYENWTDAKYVPEDTTPFYLSGDVATEDGCENGAAPVWVGKSNAIIGNLSNDKTSKKAYHDLTVSIKVNESTERELTYHLCIIKDLAY